MAESSVKVEILDGSGGPYGDVHVYLEDHMIRLDTSKNGGDVSLLLTNNEAKAVAMAFMNVLAARKEAGHEY